jgi:hypothetical protein
LHAHILNNPVGREIFGAAKVIDGDVHALSMLPYHSEKVCDDGWAMVGDAAGFIDPPYNPGLVFVLTLPISWRIYRRAVSRAKMSLSDYIITTNNIRFVRGSRVCARTNIITWATQI